LQDLPGIYTFRMDRIGVASHLYGIALDSGEYLGTTQTCLSCNIPTGATLERFSTILKVFQGAMDELIRETHPGLREEFAMQIAIDEQIENDPRSLSTELRNALIREVFQRRQHISKRSGKKAATASFSSPCLRSILPRLRSPMP